MGAEVEMERYRTAATIETQGELHLSELPFRSGDEVDVIVVRRRTQAPSQSRYPLRGREVRFDRPFDSVAEEDWDASS